MSNQRKPADVPMPAPSQTYLTRLEACQFARISVSTFDREVAGKRITVHRVGNRVRVRRTEMERWIENPPGNQ